MNRYRQGWRALNRLLHENKSFSGHEKNCAFLNMGNGQFASVSSVCGLDFDDDSRAVATCDWDFDGRQDFWMTGRTAPRLRFVRNQNANAGDFIALKLTGNGNDTNRNAIGARVEVVLGDRGENERLIKTVHAGDAFLSQSSSWLHFGIGDASEREIEKVIIDWPTRTMKNRRQTLRGVSLNRFYQVRQGSAAVAWKPPSNRKPLIPSTNEPPANSESTIRIAIPAKLPLPDIQTVDGETISLEGPLLVNVWSSTCPLCIAELKAWSAEEKEFARRGLRIIALNADENLSAAEHAIKETGFSMPWAIADHKSIQSLDFFQRAMLDRWEPLPVPCSFLLDKTGQVVVIYKGVVSPSQIMDDLTLIDASPDVVRKSASPFKGAWLRSVPSADPTAVSTQMIDHRAIDEATAYLGRYAVTKQREGTITRSKLADILYVLSILQDSQGHRTEAIASVRKAAELNPTDIRPHQELARMLEKSGDLAGAEAEWAAAHEVSRDNQPIRQSFATNLLRQKKFSAAVKLLERAVAQSPNDAGSHFQLATAHRNLGKWPEAIASYQRAIDHQPTMVLAANNLAYILATHPDDSLRNGEKAVELAERVCEMTRNSEPLFLDTLAVAYAERRDFVKAIETTQLALKILKANDRSTLTAEQPLLDRIEMFQKRRPFRESP
ncbi:tetratricopeptide repeat protein [Planctomycetota bacterium]